MHWAVTAGKTQEPGVSRQANGMKRDAFVYIYLVDIKHTWT
jgi:hypothetical protein